MDELQRREIHERAEERARRSLPDGALAAEHPASRLNWVQHWFAWHLTRTAGRLLLGFRVENEPRIDGGYVIVANHGSFFDPLFVACASRRRVTFLMTVLHYRSNRLGWFYRWSRSIPLAVRGASNRGAMRAAKAVLRRGEVLAVFPEGGLTRDGEPLLGSPGAVSLVLSEDVPIVPMWLEGAYATLPLGGKLRLFRGVTARFGEPVRRQDLVAGVDDRRQQLKVATARVMERIAELGGRPSRERWLAERAAVAVPDP